MTTESTTPRWVTSSYSSNGGSCVEWAPAQVAATSVVPLRDSKNPAGPVLAIPARAFTSFVSGVKNGEFGAV
ncbi:DUF397 domain-containing protein [Streptomyces sp. JJ66]|uniref:DUF397 domain-containing protein n=1 Tax=Streptomyces sp. JJ66 TaxID=2803843 RepID=UPI001C5774BD|nr:DUF397 domain-containing protein [Streptomyces sp. JJ66]MBW1601420.1 DUF397 domain-containing protein [Streptomyces sp. JJ66]